MPHDFIRLTQVFFLPAADTFQEVAWRPAVDVYRTRRGWLVKVELAGVRPQDISLTVQGRRLTVAGFRRDCSAEEECHCHVMEISYSHFERTVELPHEVESAPIEAAHENGILMIRIRTEGEE